MSEDTVSRFRIPCRYCGVEFRADCPDRCVRAERAECSCGGGCANCDWNGYNLITVGGHSTAIRLTRLNESLAS